MAAKILKPLAPGLLHSCVVSGFTHKHLTRLERPARCKRSSLLQTLVDYGQKYFITLNSNLLHSCVGSSFTHRHSTRPARYKHSSLLQTFINYGCKFIKPFASNTLVQTPALLTNIRLGQKCLPGTNTLAYYKHLYVMAANILKPLALRDQ